jgi:hypothetical protein
VKEKMRTRFTAFYNFLAVLCAILFVIATVPVLLLSNSKQTLLNAEAYKRALIDNKAYEQLPALMAEGSSSLERFLEKPCTDNLLVCAMDNASPELQICLTDSLGPQAYGEIGSGQRDATDVEQDSSQACLDRYASTTLQTGPEAGSLDDQPLSSAPAKVQACARQVLGDEAYQTLSNNQRPPTKRETRQINACIRQARREARLNNSGIGGELMPILKDFSLKQWEELIRFLLPADELQEMTEAALDQVFSYLKGESNRASISLVNLKTRLRGQAGQELILFLLNAQPPCTEEQQAKINAGDFENGGGTAIYCAASGETLAQVIPPMQNRLSRLAAQIPNEAVLIKPISTSDAISGGDPFITIRRLRSWMRLSPLLPVSLLVLVTLFGVRSVKSGLRWWGIPLLSAGLIVLSIGIAAQPLLDWAWVNYAIPQFPSVISSGLAELGHDMFRSVVHELGKWLMLEAGPILLLGLAAIIGSFYVGPITPSDLRSPPPNSK